MNPAFLLTAGGYSLAVNKNGVSFQVKKQEVLNIHLTFCQSMLKETALLDFSGRLLSWQG